MTNEEIYDAEIAPELAKIGKRCEELGMPFLASVEFDAQRRGTTEFRPENTSCIQLLIHWAASCNGNVDILIGAIDKYAKKNGHSSIYLQMLGNKNIKYSGNEMAAIAVTKS